MGVSVRVVLGSVAALLLFGASPGHGQVECPADADGDLRITISELIGAVRTALYGCPVAPDVCHADADGNGSVSIAELMAAVGASLEGCPAQVQGRIVRAAWLRQHLDDRLVQVIDARVGGFPDGHIPGALPLDPYALATTRDGVPFQILEVPAAEEVLSAAGLRRPTIAVVYGGEPEFDPARVVWALTYLGHRDVRFLDGGWQGWLDAGGPVAEGDPLPGPPTDYVIDGTAPGIRVDGQWILERLGPPPYDDPEIQIVDARSLAEYEAGFIPTAVHRPWPINLYQHARVLLPRDELEALYADLDKSRTTVVYCLAGWRAALTWLVLVQLGFEDVRVYDASWLEWGDVTRGFPIAQPEFTAEGVTASCRVRNKGGPPEKDNPPMVLLALANGSGVEIRDVRGGELLFDGGMVEVVAAPSPQASVANGDVTVFEWRLRLTGTTRVSASLSYVDPNDVRFEIGPIDCGSASVTSQ